jgi:hypothetical protein
VWPWRECSYGRHGMDKIDRVFVIACLCVGGSMFVFGMWFLIGGVVGLRQAIRHIKDWF